VGWSVLSLSRCSSGVPTKLPAPIRPFGPGEAIRLAKGLAPVSPPPRRLSACCCPRVPCDGVFRIRCLDSCRRGVIRISASCLGRRGHRCSRRGCGLRRGGTPSLDRECWRFYCFRHVEPASLGRGRLSAPLPRHSHADDGCLEPCLTRAMQSVFRASFGRFSASLWASAGWGAVRTCLPGATF
jgi:hypothetical protein